MSDEVIPDAWALIDDTWIAKFAADTRAPEWVRVDVIDKLKRLREIEMEKLRTMPCATCGGSGRVPRHLPKQTD